MSAREPTASGRKRPMSVKITAHAVQRAKQRLPLLFAKLPYEEVQYLLRREVSEAFDAGRVSVRQPRFVAGQLQRRKAGGNGRYAWSENEQIAMVLHQRHGSWWVVTVIPNRWNEDEAVA